MQTKDKIAAAVKAAVEAAMNDGALKFSDALPEVALEVPPKKEFGDFATNFAMQTAKIFRTSPRKIAEEIKARINSDLFERIEIAGAGFMNFYLRPDVIYRALKEIYDAGENFGHLPNKNNVTIQIEYVSANPTGLLHVGHGRGAAAGSAIVNIMRAAGYNVESEYYINDAGNQMDKLALSVNARYLELLGEKIDFPEDGYLGADIIDTTKRIIARHGKKFLKLPDDERLKILGDLAYADKMFELQKDLENFRVHFDVWFSEKTLHPEKINSAIETLKASGGIYDRDGALWLASSKFGDDKDRVVIRENGEPTYLAADIAYHKNKFDRGFGELINLWGADHHGYVARVKAAMKMLGYDADKLKIIFLQMVSLFRSGEAVKMSKRAGTAIPLRELMDEVGTDAARYFFLMRSTDSQLDFDLDLAKSQSADNPVYYIQYAHARICSIFRQAAEAGLIQLGIRNEELGIEPKFSLMNSTAEIDLINKIFEYPEEIEKAAAEYAPQRIARYVYDLASTFSSFYRDCRILGVEKDLAIARLALLEVTQHTIKHALNLLGVSAPDHM
ncbi:MAG: arginine--tRNA ligase [Selenomonadaceae bacterium]|nr:arginine--tRNA ligase [Selenomonadaceae bacterium]MBQ9496887.1 arginine--tRNA ligase [Selenomonadaceae bacterium]